MKRIMTGRAAKLLLTVLLILNIVFLLPQPRAEAAQGENARWTALLKKYKKKKADRLIFVQYKGGSRCRVRMYKKILKENGKTGWKRILSCAGYVGQNGIGKERQGDMKTPKGTYAVTAAFGILDDPGTQIPYIKLNRYLYWSGEAGTYNTMVDSRQLGHIPSGSEHLIAYDPYYNYALAIGYNKKCIAGKGAAIFLHCTGERDYTHGCVAIPEKKMRRIMLNATKRTKICIYPM